MKEDIERAFQIKQELNDRDRAKAVNDGLFLSGRELEFTSKCGQGEINIYSLNPIFFYHLIRTKTIMLKPCQCFSIKDMFFKCRGRDLNPLAP